MCSAPLHLSSYALPIRIMSTAAYPPSGNHTLTRVLLAGALVTAVPIWWMLATPVIAFTAAQRHVGHFAVVFVHMLGGTVMLFGGAANVFIGQTRRWFAWHRQVGMAYLLVGGVGGITGLALSMIDGHHNPGIAFATGSLAVAWLVVTALAWRAARNRRHDAHRDLMIRSYVLTWSFVACRWAGRAPSLSSFGDPSGSTAVWLTWVVPLMISEVMLQWQRTAARPATRQARDGEASR